MTAPTPSPLERRLIEAYQRGLPLTPRPYAAMAATLGVDEDAVIAAIADLQRAGIVGRVGAVVRPNSAGASTLAAMAVPASRLDQVAAIVSAQPEVNHNYEREHRFNLWFVVTAASADDVHAVLRRIEGCTGLPVLDLPLLREYRIDLGFTPSWS